MWGGKNLGARSQKKGPDKQAAIRSFMIEDFILELHSEH
jgi:hypothetical protein